MARGPQPAATGAVTVVVCAKLQPWPRSLGSTATCCIDRRRSRCCPALAGHDVEALLDAGAPCEVPGWFTPDVAVLKLAVTALDLASPPGLAPPEYEGMRERYLPEVAFSGRVEHRNSQYALYETACLRGGVQPDLANDAGWWKTRLWIYAVYALVISSRAAAERSNLTVEQLASELARRHNLLADVEQGRLADG